jgi:hypothetical protein
MAAVRFAVAGAGLLARQIATELVRCGYRRLDPAEPPTGVG